MQVHGRTPRQSAIKHALGKILGITETQLKGAPPHQLSNWRRLVGLHLKRERNRGCVRHYRYDLNYHIALAALHNELDELLGAKKLVE